MGGGQSLTIGLTHLEQFAWVGGMSASVAKREFVLGGVINDPKVANRQLKLLWFTCGQSDGLMRPNEKAWLIAVAGFFKFHQATARLKRSLFGNLLLRRGSWVDGWILQIYVV
jgi:hypothetical protein